MTFRIVTYFQCWLAAVLGLPGAGNLFSNDIVPRSISSGGLTVDWVSQIDVGGPDTIVDFDFNISYEGKPIEIDGQMVPSNKTTTYFVIEYETNMERISEHDLDAFGKPLGIAGAETQANVRKEIIEAELKAMEKAETQVHVRKVVLPDTTIYALASNGLVTAIDAETGRTKWKTGIGSPDYPSTGIGSGSDYVAAVNGSTVYCLEAATGKIVWNKRCSSAPIASPAVSAKFIFVPLVNGKIESFSIEGGIGNHSLGTSGKSTARPLVTSETVSWTTDKGFFAVAPIDQPSMVHFRLNTGDAIPASAGFQNGTMFVASAEGLVYAIEEKSGSIEWEFSTGQRLKLSPIPIGDSVLVITTRGMLFKLDVNSGKLAEGWEAPISDVDQFVGLSAERIYVLDRYGRIKVIDRNSGTVVTTVSESPIEMVVANNKSDRLYVATRTGSIQCLREIGRELPYFHGEEMMAEKPAAADDGTDPFAVDAKPSETADPSESPDAEADDPFDTSDEKDPEPSAVDEKSKEADPFAEEPEKSGDDKNTEPDDPFSGGGADDADESDDDSSESGDDDAGNDDSDNPFSGGDG